MHKKELHFRVFRWLAWSWSGALWLTTALLAQGGAPAPMVATHPWVHTVFELPAGVTLQAVFASPGGVWETHHFERWVIVRPLQPQVSGVVAMVLSSGARLRVRVESVAMATQATVKVVLSQAWLEYQ